MRAARVVVRMPGTNGPLGAERSHPSRFERGSRSKCVVRTEWRRCQSSDARRGAPPPIVHCDADCVPHSDEWSRRRRFCRMADLSEGSALDEITAPPTCQSSRLTRSREPRRRLIPNCTSVDVLSAPSVPASTKRGMSGGRRLGFLRVQIYRDVVNVRVEQREGFVLVGQLAID